MRSAFIFAGLTLAVAASVFAFCACGPALFPKCGEPGVNCPPCTGKEVYPDPCAMHARDAGDNAETGK